MKESQILPVTVAAKIRCARLAAGLTQAELAGDHITRNMMCRIENGSATASRATLAYFAERLNLPPLYLSDDTVSLTDCLKLQYIPDLHREFAAGHYREVSRLYKLHFRQPDDELALMMADVSCHLATAAVHSGNLDSAMRLITDSLDFCEKTVLPTDGIRASALLLRAVAANVQSPRYEISEDTYCALSGNAALTDFYYYLTENTALCRHPLYQDHLRARDALHARDYRTALPLLRSLEEKRAEKEMSAFLLFRVYTDLEQYYKETSDYESAYRYAGKRISMLAAFRS